MSGSPKYQPHKSKIYNIDGNKVDIYYYLIHDPAKKRRHKFTPNKKHVLDTEHEGIYHPLCKIPGFDYSKYNITVNDIRDGEKLIYNYNRNKPFAINGLTSDNPLFIKLLISMIVCQNYAVFKRFEYDYLSKRGNIDLAHEEAAMGNLEILEMNLNLLRTLVTSEQYNQITTDLIKNFGNYLKIRNIYHLFSSNPEKYPYPIEVNSFNSNIPGDTPAIPVPKASKRLPF